MLFRSDDPCTLPETRNPPSEVAITSLNSVQPRSNLFCQARYPFPSSRTIHPSLEGLPGVALVSVKLSDDPARIKLPSDNALTLVKISLDSLPIILFHNKPGIVFVENDQIGLFTEPPLPSSAITCQKYLTPSSRGGSE